jgi:LEA14-like dessication related protein
MSPIGRRGALVLISTFTLLATGACKKPLPPQLTPKEAKVTAVDLTGFDMRVKMEAFNPNGFELSVRSVVGHVVVDGTHDLGTVTSAQPISLPANARTVIDVPLNMKWKGAVNLATLAAARRAIPYTVDGTATVGGESLNIDVPFKLQGTITPEQLQQAGLKSLQNIPGLPPGLLPK